MDVPTRNARPQGQVISEVPCIFATATITGQGCHWICSLNKHWWGMKTNEAVVVDPYIHFQRLTKLANILWDDSFTAWVWTHQHPYSSIWSSTRTTLGNQKAWTGKVHLSGIKERLSGTTKGCDLCVGWRDSAVQSGLEQTNDLHQTHHMLRGLCHATLWTGDCSFWWIMVVVLEQKTQPAWEKNRLKAIWRWHVYC